jgi:hypothetical protein
MAASERVIQADEKTCDEEAVTSIFSRIRLFCP